MPAMNNIERREEFSIGFSIFHKIMIYAEIRISDTGTGQGLAIAYSVIVENHKGTIDFETETGKGTTFIIRLPLGDHTS